MEVKFDGNGHPYLQWEQSPGDWKRAWIQHRSGDKDYAGCGRYLNVVRTGSADGGPAGNATDFAIHSKLEDEQVLIAFVASVRGLTGTLG